MENTVNAPATLADLFGAPIYVYTAEQALADGVLVDARVIAPDVARQHAGSAPVYLTAELWALIEKAVANKRWCNDVSGVWHDVLWMAGVAQLARLGRIDRPERRHFRVIIKGAGRQSIYTLALVSDGAALTLMLDNED